MSRGWIPAHRKLFDPDYWMAPTKKDPASRIHAWLDLCQMAQHETYEHAGERLNQGEVLVSVRYLSTRWGWSKSKVDRFVDRLKCGTQIGTVRETPRGTVYRIVNYDTYAIHRDSERDTQRDTQRDRSGTRAGQEQQCTTNKPSKNPSVVENFPSVENSTARVGWTDVKAEAWKGMGLERLTYEEEQRNADILRQWQYQQKRKPADVLAAIRGFCIMRERGDFKDWKRPIPTDHPVGLRVLYNTGFLQEMTDGKVERPLYSVAQDVYFGQEEDARRIRGKTDLAPLRISVG